MYCLFWAVWSGLIFWQLGLFSCHLGIDSAIADSGVCHWFVLLSTATRLLLSQGRGRIIVLGGTAYVLHLVLLSNRLHRARFQTGLDARSFVAC